MLDKLKEKYPDKDIQLICGNYLEYDFGKNCFDTAISFQTMHHFTHAEKVALYTKVYHALNSKGVYIECDYMVTDQAEEDRFFAEYAKLRQKLNLSEGELYHYDTPCTIDNQIALLKQAGFSNVEMVWRMGNTTIIIAKK